MGGGFFELDGSSLPNISENTSSTEELQMRRTLSENIILSLLVALIAITSILGNLLVIVCFRWDPRLREETGNIFIVNLSITDMTCASTVMASTLMALSADEWRASNFMCDAMCALNYVLIIVSMLTLCFISIDRFIAVVYALQYYEIVSKRKTLMLICFAWFQGLCFGLSPPLRHWVHYDYWEMVCAINWARDVGAVIYVIFAFVLCFLIPGVVLATAYTKIMQVAKSIEARGVGAAQYQHKSQLKKYKSRCCGKQRRHTSDEKEKIFTRRNTGRDSLTIQSEAGGKRSTISMQSYILDQQNDVAATEIRGEEKASGATKSNVTDFNVEAEVMPIAVIADSGHNHDRENDDPHQHQRMEPNSPTANGDSMSSLTKTQQSEQSGDRIHCPESSVEVIDNDVYSNGSCPKSRRCQMERSERRSSERLHSANSASRKAIQSLRVVVIVFFVCMTPFCITKLYKVIMRNTGALPGYVNVTATIFQFCSSAVNPFIYGIFRKDFQQASKKLLSIFLAKCRSTFGKKCICARPDDFIP